jgi:hypothetical protein
MKDWVKHFLTGKLYKEARAKWGKNQPTDSKKEMVTMELERLMASETGIYYALIECLQCYFGEEIDPNVAATFSQLFGSVLVDLPEEVFIKISKMGNLFFLFNPIRQTWAAQFKIKEALPVGEVLKIVNYFYQTPYMPKKAAIGEVVQGLVMAYSDEDLTEDKMFESAKNWGFGEEMKELFLLFSDEALEVGRKGKIDA